MQARKSGTDEAELIIGAATLGVSRERCQRMVLTGRLRGQRRNGRWYVSMRSVREELARREREATQVAGSAA